MSISDFIVANPEVVKNGLKQLDKNGITDPDQLQVKLGEYIVNQAITTGLEKGWEGADAIALEFGGAQAKYLANNKDVLDAARKSGKNIFTFAKEHANANGWKEGRETFGIAEGAQLRDSLYSQASSAKDSYMKMESIISRVGGSIEGGFGLSKSPVDAAKALLNGDHQFLESSNEGKQLVYAARRLVNDHTIDTQYGGIKNQGQRDRYAADQRNFGNYLNTYRDSVYANTSGVMQEAVRAGVDLKPLFGDTYGASERFRRMYGFSPESKNNNRILHNNPASQNGNYEFDPLFGTRYHRELAESIGEQVGLSKDEVRQTVGNLLADKAYRNDGSYRFLVNYEKGQTDPNEAFSGTFAKDYTQALLGTAGIQLPPEKLNQLLNTVNDAAYKAADALFVPNKKSNGFFKNFVSGFAGSVLDLAGDALKPIGLEDYAAPIIGAGVTLATGGAGAGVLSTIGSAAAGAAVAGSLPGLAAGDFSEAFKNGLKGAGLAAIGAGLGAEFASNVPDIGALIDPNGGLFADLGSSVSEGIKGVLQGKDFLDSAAGGFVNSDTLGGLFGDISGIINENLGSAVGGIVSPALEKGIIDLIKGDSFRDATQEELQKNLLDVIGDEAKQALGNLENPFEGIALPDIFGDINSPDVLEFLKGIELPDLSGLRDLLPEIQFPDVNIDLPPLPDLGGVVDAVKDFIPDINLPDIDLDIDLPEFDPELPDLDIELPEVDLGEFNLPSLPQDFLNYLKGIKLPSFSVGFPTPSFNKIQNPFSELNNPLLSSKNPLTQGNIDMAGTFDSLLGNNSSLISALLSGIGSEVNIRDLQDAGKTLGNNLTNLAGQAGQGATFKPFNLTTNVGATSRDAQGNSLVNLSPEQQALYQKALGQASNNLDAYSNPLLANQTQGLLGASQGFLGRATQDDAQMAQQRATANQLFGSQAGNIGQGFGALDASTGALRSQGQNQFAQSNMYSPFLQNQLATGQGIFNQGVNQYSAGTTPISQQASQLRGLASNQLANAGNLNNTLQSQIGTLQSQGQQAFNQANTNDPRIQQQISALQGQGLGLLGQSQAGDADLQRLRGQYGDAASNMAGMLGKSTDDRATELYNLQQQMQQPGIDRQRLALENRLRAQGRLGQTTAAFGGTSEQLAFEKALQEQDAANRFNSITGAEQLASSEQARALGLGSQVGNIAGLQDQLSGSRFGRGLSALGQAQQGISQQDALRNSAFQRGLGAFGLGQQGEQLQSGLLNDQLQRGLSTAQSSQQATQLDQSLLNNYLQNALSGAQLGQSAQALQEQLQQGAFGRGATSTQLANQQQGLRSDLENAQLQRALQAGQFGTGLAQANQALQQGNAGLAQGLFGAGLQGLMTPEQINATRTGLAAQQQGMARQPVQDLLQQLGLGFQMESGRAGNQLAVNQLTSGINERGFRAPMEADALAAQLRQQQLQALASAIGGTSQAAAQAGNSSILDQVNNALGGVVGGVNDSINGIIDGITGMFGQQQDQNSQLYDLISNVGFQTPQMPQIQFDFGNTLDSIFNGANDFLSSQPNFSLGNGGSGLGLDPNAGGVTGITTGGGVGFNAGDYPELSIFDF